MQRREAQGYNLRNLAKMQKHARLAAAHLDDVLSEQNNKVVIPERLDIEFKEGTDGQFYVEPVLLTQDDAGELQAIDSQSFQQKFDTSSMVQNVYRLADRTRFVCTPEVKQGLEQMKRVRCIRREDKARYEAQPRELFSAPVFYFENKEKSESAVEQDTTWLPDEGELFEENYSARVKGITAVQKKQSYSSGHKMTWLSKEAGVAERNEASLHAGQQVQSKDQSGKALAINDNVENIDYALNVNPRVGALSPDCLKEGVHLLDYQKAGIAWMFKDWQEGYNGVLLADDMGLGKTLQTLAFLAALKKDDVDKQKPVLLVAPIALQKNWQKEYQKFIKPSIFSMLLPLHGSTLSTFETGEIAPNNKKKLQLIVPMNTLAITTYETLRDYQFSFAEVNWGIIVVDEAQKLKNPTSGITKALKAMKYDYAICLSGTPVENSWVDLWSIMDFVQPGKLRDLKWFKTHYVNAVDDSDLSSLTTLGQKLKRNLAPLFLRRMKKDKLSGLPQKYVHVCREQMPDYQKRCYMSILAAAQQQNMHPFMLIARMRDISLHPDIGTKRLDAFYQMPPDDIIGQSARLLATFRILAEVEARGEKALVFVVSKKMQAILKYVIEQKYHLQLLPPVNGSMNGQARQRIIDKFNALPGFNVLILSPEAAGVGFTITSANHVIHLSRTWNPAKEDQATDRVYRIGQDKDVHVYLPLACHKDLGEGESFDEKLNELLEFKRQLSDNVLFPTGDSQNDGMRIFEALTKRHPSTTQNYYWTIADIDHIVGDAFAAIVVALYNGRQGYQASRTQHNNNYGVDVVVLADSGKTGSLLKCQRLDNAQDQPGVKCVQDVYAAIPYYEKLYPGYMFQVMVLTNAEHFSAEAESLASMVHVKLVVRENLQQLLTRYPVVKNC